MFQRGFDLICEFLAVDGGATTAGARGVTALDHEVGDYTVEDDVVVVAAGGEGAEVFAGSWGVRGVEFYCYHALLDCQIVFGSGGWVCLGRTIVVSRDTSEAIAGIDWRTSARSVDVDKSFCCYGLSRGRK